MLVQITLEQVEAWQAYFNSECSAFQGAFGDSVIVTEDTLGCLNNIGISNDFIAKHLLVKEIYNLYYESEREAYDIYDKKTSPAWKAFFSKANSAHNSFSRMVTCTEPGDTEHSKAYDNYWRRRDAAMLECNMKTTEAWEEYSKRRLGDLFAAIILQEELGIINVDK